MIIEALRIGDYKAHINFVVESYNNSYAINDCDYGFIDYLPTELSEFYEDNFPISITAKIISIDCRKIGYYERLHTPINGHAGGKLFIHPDSNPRDCLRAVEFIVRAVSAWGLTIEDVKHYEFDTWHDSIVKVAKKVMPCFKEHYIYDTYRILHCSKDELLKHPDTVTNILKSIEHIDENYERVKING